MILLDDSNETSGQAVDAAGVPMGETKLEAPALPVATDHGNAPATKETSKKNQQDTASAADAIYDRYRRRPRK
jgi:hypothetical protein